MAKKPAKNDAPEPAVMASGASAENAAEGKGSPPADTSDAAPEAKGDATSASGEAPDDGGAASAAETTGEVGFRDEQGRFTGNPATLEEKVDALVKMAEQNGWSLPKELQ